MLVTDAVRAFGYDDTDDGVVCVAYFDDAGGCRHISLPALAGAKLADYTDLYVATGLFTPGRLSPTHGRTRENLARVLDLPLDCDLTTYVGVSKDDLFTYPDADLDDAATALADDVAALALYPLGLTPSRVVMTGYGIQIMLRLDQDVQEDIAAAQAANKALVERINAAWGGPLADPQVNDAGTRIVRVPGCVNTKGKDHGRLRHCVQMGEGSLYRVDREQVLLLASGRQGRHGAELRDREPLLGISLAPEQREGLARIVSSAWTEGQRHAVALGLAGLLAKSGVAEGDAALIVEMSSGSDPELRDRLRAVQTTYRHYHQGRPVAGFTRLAQTLVPETMHALDRELYPVSQAVRSTQAGRTIVYTRGVEAGGNGAAPGRDDQGHPHFRQTSDVAWTEFFREYRDVVGPTTEACDDFHLASALVMAGLTIGRRAFVRHGARLYGNLYAVLVGETGRSRKSTAISRAESFFALQNPARGWEPSFPTLYGLSSAEGLLEHMVPHPKLLVVDEEFTEVMHKGRQQATANLLPTLTRLWDARDFHSLPTRNNPIHVDLPTLAFLGATTPHALSEDIGERQLSSGFANRILFVYGQGGDLIDDPPDMDMGRAMVLLARLKDAVRQLPAGGVALPLTTAAKAFWKPMYHAIHAMDHATEASAQMAQRLQENIFKIALIHAVSNGKREIDEPHVAAAADFVWTCFENTKDHAATWGANDEAKMTNAILDTLFESGPLTRADLFYRLGRRSGFPMLQRILESGERMGVLHSDIQGLVSNERTHHDA